MKKNVSGQKIGVQMVSATDGSAFTGAVTVFVTGDAGTQAQGTVGSGACTHEGNGFHTYAPSQAETNFDHIAFTFIGTGAVPSTLQVYPTFPQTGDNFTRLGAPAGASIAADVADLPTNAELATALATADDATLAAIAALNNLSQANVRTAVGLASANLDTQLDALPTNSELSTALAAADDAVLAAIAALPTANANATALLDLAAGVETGLTLRQALRLLVAAMAGKVDGAATTTITIRNFGDTKDRIVATVTADGDRTAVGYDLS